MNQEIKKLATTVMFNQTVSITVAPGCKRAAVDLRSEQNPDIHCTLYMRVEDIPRPRFDELFEDEMSAVK